MTVLENLALVPPAQAGERVWESWLRPWRVAREERVNAARAKEVLELVELGDLVYEYAGNLSGGQRKLLELARALMARPKMVLLDEPAAGVNPTLVRRLIEHIQRDPAPSWGSRFWWWSTTWMWCRRCAIRWW